MRIATGLSLIFGIFLILGGFVFLTYHSMGEQNSSLEKELDVPENHFFTVGGEKADKIVGEYSATEPVNVYLTTNDSVKTEHIASIESLENYTVLAVGEKAGILDYQTPDSEKKYYIIFNNPNNASIHLDISVEFESSERSTVCLLPGIILLLSGIILIAVGVNFHRKSKRMEELDNNDNESPEV
ncbi:hypothetical protein [[Eubacterium] cellulosolvens]